MQTLVVLRLRDHAVFMEGLQGGHLPVVESPALFLRGQSLPRRLTNYNNITIIKLPVLRAMRKGKERKGEIVMAYCKSCGAEIHDQAVVCPHCGVAQETKPAVVDNGGFGWGLLGFCIPLVGLILYLVWKGEKPRTAKAAGKGALISVIIYVVFYVLMVIIGLGAGMTGY